MQVSRQAQGIIDKGFDAALSIGLLIVGMIVLGWYHWRYQKHNRKVIEKLADEKDQRTEKFVELIEQNTVLSEKQINSNKKLTVAVDRLTEKIEQKL